MAYADRTERREWQAKDRSEPCSQCGHLTMHRDRLCKDCRPRSPKSLKQCSDGCGRTTHARSGRCGHCQWQAQAGKGSCSALAGKYDGPDLVFAGDVCAHPLASRMPRWTGKWCGLCNREVGHP